MRPALRSPAPRASGALLLLVALAGLAPAPALHADDAHEPLFKLEPALVASTAEQERPVLLLVTASWKRACRRFEAEALERDDVRSVLAKDWLRARIEAPLDDDLARTYEITVFPTLVVLDRLGGLVEKIEGERPADLLVADLAQALASAREQEAETRSLLAESGGAESGGTVAERLERARALMKRGLAKRAAPLLEALTALDPEDREGAGLFALAKLSEHAFRAGDLARGDAGLARVSSLAQGSAWVAGLRRERVQALRRARRFAEAREELARLAAAATGEEREALALDEAALLRAEGRGDEARAKLEALWESASPASRSLVEAALDADPAAHGPSEWRTLRDGRRLVLRFGCAECHPIERAVLPGFEGSCVQCHQRITAGFKTAEERRDALALDAQRYSAERNIRHYLHAPDLSTVTVRLRREWLRSFIRHPVDVRPFLQESMPRLPISDGEIDLVLDYLDVVGRRAVGLLAPAPLPAGDVGEGERLFQSKGCQACHVFGNRVFPESPPATPWPRLAPANIRDAPNLRWARARARREVLPLWIRDARRFVKDTPMPAFELTDAEVGHLIAFLERGDPGPPAPLAVAASLPPAQAAPAREEEVREVFLDTCKHCHLRDELGGIGNAGGGFGYAPVGLDLESESGLARGSVGPDGRRRPAPLLARLLWRRDENRFDAWAPYRDPLIAVPAERYDHPPGMPLGLPALDDGEAALLRRHVESPGAR